MGEQGRTGKSRSKETGKMGKQEVEQRGSATNREF